MAQRAHHEDLVEVHARHRGADDVEDVRRDLAAAVGELVEGVIDRLLDHLRDQPKPPLRRQMTRRSDAASRAERVN